MIRWCDRALVKAILPYTLCTTEQLYKKAVAQLGHKSVAHNEWLGEGAAGQTRAFFKEDTPAVIIVTVSPTKNVTEAFLTIVHEAVHVWRYQKEAIGESAPAVEEEAYAIESITRNLWSEYTRQVAPKPKKKKTNDASSPRKR